MTDIRNYIGDADDPEKLSEDEQADFFVKNSTQYLVESEYISTTSARAIMEQADSIQDKENVYAVVKTLVNAEAKIKTVRGLLEQGKSVKDKDYRKITQRLKVDYTKKIPDDPKDRLDNVLGTVFDKMKNCKELLDNYNELVETNNKDLTDDEKNEYKKSVFLSAQLATVAIAVCTAADLILLPLDAEHTANLDNYLTNPTCCKLFDFSSPTAQQDIISTLADLADPDISHPVKKARVNSAKKSAETIELRRVIAGKYHAINDEVSEFLEKQNKMLSIDNIEKEKVSEKTGENAVEKTVKIKEPKIEKEIVVEEKETENITEVSVPQKKKERKPVIVSAPKKSRRELKLEKFAERRRIEAEKKAERAKKRAEELARLAAAEKVVEIPKKPEINEEELLYKKAQEILIKHDYMQPTPAKLAELSEKDREDWLWAMDYLYGKQETKDDEVEVVEIDGESFAKRGEWSPERVKMIEELNKAFGGKLLEMKLSEVEYIGSYFESDGKRVVVAESPIGQNATYILRDGYGGHNYKQLLKICETKKEIKREAGGISLNHREDRDHISAILSAIERI